MRFQRRNDQSRVSAMELTPMIDVVFLLIIFFMLTAQFMKETRAELDLPEEAGEQLEFPEESGLIINVTRDGGIILSTQEEPMDIDTFEMVLLAAMTQDAGLTDVTIRVDRNATSSVLNRIIKRLKEQGIVNARIATAVPQGRGP
jgi:biopolymer transport protein ExbD